MSHTVTLAEARTVIAAATAEAEKIGQPMNIAVVCAGGYLLAFERMENAWLGSVDIAQKKAWTSRAFDIETGTLGTLSQSGDQFFGINASNDGKVMIFAGGVPLLRDGKVIGAIGVSGGLGAQDQAVAEAGAKTIK
ncbi:GlcG/HbpS family heme-binding protein [Granulicella tundricola]|uniref:Heme-binding protein n=1 Tax=Granulicella tundricola (strain ATCC BAA-1859 / DSM 23138 / MP5ACTX9) TaxID=1198114 RepID=E8WVJ3_GRATM|nr:heme-binding protein [Granulicella tundricola]ADW68441.1 protein of unknown function DUF336 [Granulicella tundricola MP5ACTX9]